MKTKLYKKVKNQGYLQEIRQLLIISDHEFIPPLSSRNSTTQSDLLPREEKKRLPEEYFQTIAKQSAVLAICDGKVVGFISFRTDYICEHINRQYLPNVYVTTIIVHPDFRHRGIAGIMYNKLIRHFSKHYLFTRTWSTNLSHIRILHAYNFHEHCYLDNDRGEGIDTVYYRRKPIKKPIMEYIRQYRLGGNIFFSVLLAIFSVVFIVLWIKTEAGIAHELSLAVATSLMASLLCLVSDIFLKLHDSKSDQYINTLKSFGIENLQFNKNEVLEELIPKCRDEIWISGCRLIMTGQASFRKALVSACKRSGKLNIKILASPPWSEAYKLIYGEEDVSMNYIKILADLIHCVEQYGLTLEVHFTEKPIFNDTYKVDERFISGPYLHCADRYNNRITAKDFFSLEITDPEKDLHKIIYQDYMSLWREATSQLDVERFAQIMRMTQEPVKLSPAERLSLIKSACVARLVTPAE